MNQHQWAALADAFHMDRLMIDFDERAGRQMGSRVLIPAQGGAGTQSETGDQQKGTHEEGHDRPKLEKRASSMLRMIRWFASATKRLAPQP